MLELDVTSILWNIANLLVLFLLLKHFLFKPVNAILDKRAQAIQSEREEAQAQRIEAQELKESYDQRLAQASQEAARLVAQAKSQGQREYEAILEKAQRDAQRVQQQAQAELEAQRQKALADTRQQVASLALMAAAKVAQRRMDETEDQALVEEFLREAGEAS